MARTIRVAIDIARPRQRLKFVKSFRYPLTDPRQFDILQSGPGWWGSNAILSVEAPRVHHDACGAAAGWPLAARAQQAGKLATIGCLVPGTPSSHGQWFAVFVQRLRELGWIEGRTVAVEYWWAEGRSERFTEIAAEFVQRKVDVIVTASTTGVLAAKQATSVIPIVFAAAGDPVGAGLVASLARPGGNVTGLSV